MNSKYIVISFLFLVFVVDWSVSRQPSLFDQNETFFAKPSTLITKNPKRGRRCLGTALSLLWPQVVGPVEQGTIEEKDYNEVPKTLLEHRLELIRKKAEQEEEKRLIVRDYMRKLTEAQDEFYGYSNANLLASYYT